MLTGQNGLLSQAQNASEQTKKADVIERAKTEVIAVQTENQGNITKNEYVQIIKKYFEGIEDIPDEDFPDDFTGAILKAKDEYGGQEIDLSEIYNGPFYLKGTGEIFSASDIDANPSLFYGKTVEGYISTNTSTWQIFYADSENIYLISKNNIYPTSAPNSKNHQVAHLENSRQIYFGNVYLDYESSASITDSRLEKWFGYKELYPNSTRRNVRNVAYMLDTNIWKVFAGDKAEYAIGGATLELLASSYNDIHDVKLEYNIASESGYTITSSSEMEDDVELYGDFWWIAAPTKPQNGQFGNSETYMMRANANYIGGQDFTYTPQRLPGLRPVVCLKNTTRIEKVDEDTYKIL